jgi:predicted DNA-binding transcriptional regulator AlpA
MTHNNTKGIMDILNVPTLAEMLGMTPQSLYARRCRDPESLPQAIRVGRRLIWRHETVERWLIELESSQNGPSRQKANHDAR